MFFFLIRVSHLPAQEADPMLQTALTAAVGGMHEAGIPKLCLKISGSSLFALLF